MSFPSFKGLTCAAPTDRTFAGLFGARCGAEAVYRDRLGRPLCEACGLRARKNHEEGKTILGIVHPGTPFPLERIR